jgi:transposase
MLVVETIAKIRRAFFGQGKAIKAICRELGLSRKVVRKVIRSGATEFHYEREHQPLPKIGPWRERLDTMLLTNATKPAREQLTLTRIYEELRGAGYDGSYDAVRRYAKSWREERGAVTAEAFVPLSFAPGEAYQFDWSHEIVLLNGTTVTVKVAHVRLCHSRMMFVRAYPREAQEMVFDAHDRAFAFFKGTCTRGIYDNMKTAVDAVFLNKDRQFNRRFACQSALNIDPVSASKTDPPFSRERERVEAMRVSLCLSSASTEGTLGGLSGSVLEAPALVAGLDDVAVMGEPVEESGGHLGIAEDRWPFAEGEVGGDDDGCAFIKLADQMEQELPAGLGEGQITKFIEQHEVEAAEIVGNTPLFA